MLDMSKILLPLECIEMNCVHGSLPCDLCWDDYTLESSPAMYSTVRPSRFIHPEFKIGDLVIADRSVILKPNVLVQILEEDHYNNPSGQGQVNSCVYRVMDMEGNESTINGVLLSHE